MDLVEDSVCARVLLFSRQLQSALFEAEDQNTTSDLITSDTLLFIPHSLTDIYMQCLLLYRHTTPLLHYYTSQSCGQ